MNLTKALGSVGGLTLASRVLGLVRDSLFFRFVGANFASDAFQIAFRLPNMFRALFAEGAFSAAFIPMFNRKVAEGDKAAEGSGLAHGLAFAENALSVLLPVLIVMTAIVELAAWPVTWVQTFGYGKGTPAQFDYIVLLNRLTFPYLLFISLVSLLGGILNSLHRFWVNAAAPILLNLTLIVALLFFHTHEPMATARNQAIAVTVAGILQFVWLWWACRRAGVRLRLKRPVINDDVKRLMKLILPAAAGAGAVQINLVISTALAARFLPEGSVSYIYAADRLNQLPLGLIGIGLGTVLLPTVSRLLGAGKEVEAMETQNRVMELALLLTLPATVALIVCGQPIVAALFATASISVRGAASVAGDAPVRRPHKAVSIMPMPPPKASTEGPRDRQVFHEMGQIVRALQALGPVPKQRLAEVVGAAYWEQDRFERALALAVADGLVYRTTDGLLSAS